MKLYINPVATTSRAVMAFSHIAGIEVEFVNIDLMSGEHMGETYGAVNPNRLVPALVDEEFVLTEASAILRYLAALSGSDWYPTELRERARVDEMMSWFEANLYKDFGFQYVYPQLFPHHSRGCEDSDGATVQWGKTKSATWLQILNDHYLAGNDFVAGANPTIADLLGASILSLGELVQEDFGPYPNVQRWYRGVCDMPAWAGINQAFSGFAASLAGQDFVGLA